MTLINLEVIMIEIHKKIVMEELLGLDLDKSAIKDLKQAKKDRTSKKKDAYLDIDTI